MASWAGAKRGDASVDAAGRDMLFQDWESRAAARRLGVTDRTPIPVYPEFEEIRRARIDAAPGRDGVAQALLQDIHSVIIHGNL